MASCYGRISAPSRGTAFFERLPIKTSLPDGTRVEIDSFKESDHEAGRRLMNIVIQEGLSWPFEDTMDMDAFRAYFLSHAAFVVRASPSASLASSVGTPSEYDSNRGSSEPERARCLDQTQESRDGRKRSTDNGTPLAEQQLKAAAAETNEGDGGETISDVWGTFYIKPNFPGRCSHVCNGGFITDPRRRRLGVARLMGHAFLRFAKELGYKASYFNLVFRTNEASVRLWRGLGFKELAVVPKAGRLKGIEGLVDAIQFHYDLEELCLDDLPEELRA